MHKVIIIAKREFLAAVRTKMFVVSLLIMPLLMGGSLLLQYLLRDVRDTREKVYAVIDRSGGELARTLEQKIKEHNESPSNRGKPNFRLVIVDRADLEKPKDQLREELSNRVRKGELAGFLEIGADVYQPAPRDSFDDRYAVRYQTERLSVDQFLRLIEQEVREAVQARRSIPLKLSDQDRQTLLRPVPIHPAGLTTRDPVTGQLKEGTTGSQVASLLAPAALLMLMFMSIMMVAGPSMQSVLEEKMQRIAEVLLGSVTPFQLMLGKLLGMTAVSLTIAAVYLAGGYWAANHFGYGDAVPGWLLAWFVVYQLLAAMMFGSLFIAIGAACTDMKETQSLLLPVMLIIFAPMFVLGNVLQEPNGPVATGLSFFPFATPMLMIVRQGVPPGIPLWQPLFGMALVLLTTLACVWAAGRIFRVGLLMQGKGAGFGQMIRWVFRG